MHVQEVEPVGDKIPSEIGMGGHVMMGGAVRVSVPKSALTNFWDSILTLKSILKMVN